MANATTRNLTGRTVIYSDAEEITRENVVEVLTTAYEQGHTNNSADIQYLYDYYRGSQPIQNKTKDTRPEINNKIVQNIAYQIVEFYTGYLMGEPVSYTARTTTEDISDKLNEFNNFMYSEDKVPKDRMLANWFYICGTSYRMILPDEDYNEDSAENDEAPFEIFVLDPRYTFVVYSSALGNKPLMGVKYITTEDGTNIYSCYTKDAYYLISNDTIQETKPHALGAVPIIEYPANLARLGVFEPVISLLDALNDAQSNRLDSLEQFVQALMIFKGVDVEDEEYERLQALGAIKIPNDTDVTYLTQELNQTQTQSLIDNLYDNILDIVGMPNTHRGYNSSADNGIAVIYRDGWSSAEARAKNTELCFDMSEKQFIKLALTIMGAMGTDSGLRLGNIDITFSRRNYENIQMKAQVLTTMLNNDKIHPQIAYEYCSMFVDPEQAYTKGMEWYEQSLREEEESIARTQEQFTRSQETVEEPEEEEETVTDEAV